MNIDHLEIEHSKLYVEFAKTERHEKNRQFYESVWGAPSNEVREQSEKTNRLVFNRKSPTSINSVNSRQSVFRIYKRSWSDELRASVESFDRLQEPPAANVGDRYTEALTAGAVRKIIDSGAYTSAIGKGFKSFNTLTFDSEGRERIQKVVCLPSMRGYTREKCGRIVASGKFTHLSLGYKGDRLGGEYAAGAYCKLADVKSAGDFCNGERSSGPFCLVQWETQSTIGREVSRFLDGMQKKYQRGWVWAPEQEENKTAPLQGQYEKIPPVYDVEHSEVGPLKILKKLNVLWVAENPDVLEEQEINGEKIKVKVGENPHVHMLMDWKVEKYQFKTWAKQIESLWGQGFSHLEIIRDTRAATGYLLKALGYMTKGSHKVDKTTGEIFSSQGRIKGNRYNISASARAPAWECVSEFEAAHMGAIVRQVGEDICIQESKIKAEIKAERAREKQQKATIAKLNSKNYASKISPNLVKQRLAQANQKLQQSIIRLKKWAGVIRNADYSNKFKITFRNAERFNSFLEFAILKRGWAANLAEHYQQPAIARDHKTGRLMAYQPNPKALHVKKYAAKFGAKIEEITENLNLYWQNLMSDADSQTELVSQ